MQQRRPAASGRPSGTDGSDFSYRMVVDSRYTKVAKGKSRLRLLIALQAMNQIAGAILTLLYVQKGKELDRFSILSISIGFLSLIIGELGRSRSLVTLLRLYTTTSSMATALSVACMVRNGFFSEAIHSRSVTTLNPHQLADLGRLLFGIILQLVVIVTSVSLVQNMSPPKRTQ